nr:acetyl-CoA carboxylase biotin carboxylase subunit [Clostridia bacterium]
MFKRVLIANRGEIAVRIIRACHEMGIEAIAVYSEADEDTLHAALANERICIGPAPASESYLNMNNIIMAAKLTGAEAIHPGYGFLSENAKFAKLCADNGIVFIGPDSATIDAMGDKDNARRMMAHNGVPTVPGTGIITPDDDIEALAEAVGYPLLVKASAGGGGKGIKLVESPDRLRSSFDLAVSEAESAFGYGGVFLEKYLTNVRHVEMQVLSDKFGNIVCLGERDCSLQRNRQKVIEETPCPILTDEVREKMKSAAVNAVKASNYVGAGTVEFLVTPSGEFYFIEMNTRLQVEHTVTEETSGVDIVKWQIRIAAGMELGETQLNAVPRGVAIECRINAKTTGRVDFLHLPGGYRVRFDTALVEGAVISPWYDSMLGTLIVSAPTRDEAIRKLEAALCETAISGIETNLDDQLELVRTDGFRSGDYHTRFIDN